MPSSTSRVCAAALAAAAVAVSLAPATASAGTGDTRQLPDRIFRADSPFYQHLPDWTPTAPDSDALVRDLVQQSYDYWGTPDTANVDVSTHSWAPTMYVARSSDPIATYRSNNCQGKWWGWDQGLLNDQLRGVRVPSDALPDGSSDGSMVVYNPDEDTVTETWVTQKGWDGAYTVCWGGTIRNASKNIGQFDTSQYYGVSASGLSMAGFVIRADELKAGHINHVIALNIPRVKSGPSWPATRSDGWLQGSYLSEGQLLRLPKDVDIDSMRLSPVARTIAHAAQDYGIMITDQGGSVAFVAQNSNGFSVDPYTEIFRGRWASQEMAGDRNRGERPFPLGKLQALPLNYRVQGVPDAPETPPMLRAPSPDPAPQPDLTIRQSALTTDSIRDGAGNLWAQRTPGTFDTMNMTTRPWWVPVRDASVRDVYSATAWGVSHYGVKVPNGTYDVTIYMAEDYWNRAGKRVFDILGEGQILQKDVDIWAWTGGRDRALELTYPVTVKDGELDLDWKASVDLGLVNAVKIVRR